MRTCGKCSLCCRVMGVPEVKPDHEWCPHCRPGKQGCLIYVNRPQRCRDFHCQWLIDQRFGEAWYPLRSKIIIDHRLDGEKTYVYFVVDPTVPGRWREEPWFSDIKSVARTGIEGRLGAHWITLVLVGEERIVIGN